MLKKHVLAAYLIFVIYNVSITKKKKKKKNSCGKTHSNSQNPYVTRICTFRNNSFTRIPNICDNTYGIKDYGSEIQPIVWRSRIFDDGSVLIRNIRINT